MLYAVDVRHIGRCICSHIARLLCENAQRFFKGKVETSSVFKRICKQVIVFTVTYQEKKFRRSEIYLFLFIFILFYLFIVFLKKCLFWLPCCYISIDLLYTYKENKRMQKEITDCLFEFSSICTYNIRSPVVVCNVFVGRCVCWGVGGGRRGLEKVSRSGYSKNAHCFRLNYRSITYRY